MPQAPDIFGIFNDRVRRHVRDALSQYRDELKAVSHEMAAKRLPKSGPHMQRRADVLAKWMQTLTDQCFEDVTRLPGTQSMQRWVHAEFLEEQLLDFLRQAEAELGRLNFGSQDPFGMSRFSHTIREGLDDDLRDFQAGLWSRRSNAQNGLVTNNTVNIHRSNVGLVQQAGESSAQSATVTLNVQAVQTALEQFVTALNAAEMPVSTRQAVAAEVETILPQLKKQSPNAAIIREAGKSIRTILENTASGVLASALWALMTATGTH